MVEIETLWEELVKKGSEKRDPYTLGIIKKEFLLEKIPPRKRWKVGEELVNYYIDNIKSKDLNSEISAGVASTLALSGSKWKGYKIPSEWEDLNYLFILSEGGRVEARKVGDYCGYGSERLKIEVEEAGDYFMGQSFKGKVKAKKVGDKCGLDSRELKIKVGEAGDHCMTISKVGTIYAERVGDRCGYGSVRLKIKVGEAGDDFMAYSKWGRAVVGKVGDRCGRRSEGLKIEACEAEDWFMEGSTSGLARVEEVGDFCGWKSEGLKIEVRDTGILLGERSKGLEIKKFGHNFMRYKLWKI